MSSVASVCRAHGKRMSNVYSMRVPTLINKLASAYNTRYTDVFQRITKRAPLMPNV